MKYKRVFFLVDCTKREISNLFNIGFKNKVDICKLILD